MRRIHMNAVMEPWVPSLLLNLYSITCNLIIKGPSKSKTVPQVVITQVDGYINLSFNVNFEESISELLLTTPQGNLAITCSLKSEYEANTDCNLCASINLNDLDIYGGLETLHKYLGKIDKKQKEIELQQQNNTNELNNKLDKTSPAESAKKLENVNTSDIVVDNTFYSRQPKNYYFNNSSYGETFIIFNTDYKDSKDIKISLKCFLYSDNETSELTISGRFHYRSSDNCLRWYGGTTVLCASTEITAVSFCVMDTGDLGFRIKSNYRFDQALIAQVFLEEPDQNILDSIRFVRSNSLTTKYAYDEQPRYTCLPQGMDPNLVLTNNFNHSIKPKHQYFTGNNYSRNTLSISFIPSLWDSNNRKYQIVSFKGSLYTGNGIVPFLIMGSINENGWLERTLHVYSDSTLLASVDFTKRKSNYTSYHYVSLNLTGYDMIYHAVLDSITVEFYDQSLIENASFDWTPKYNDNYEPLINIKPMPNIGIPRDALISAISNDGWVLVDQINYADTFVDKVGSVSSNRRIPIGASPSRFLNDRRFKIKIEAVDSRGVPYCMPFPRTMGNAATPVNNSKCYHAASIAAQNSSSALFRKYESMTAWSAGDIDFADSAIIISMPAYIDGPTYCDFIQIEPADAHPHSRTNYPYNNYYVGVKTFDWRKAGIASSDELLLNVFNNNYDQIDKFNIYWKLDKCI